VIVPVDSEHLAERRHAGLAQAAPNLRTLTFGYGCVPATVQAASEFKQLARLEVGASNGETAAQDAAVWDAALDVMKRSQAAGPKVLVRINLFGEATSPPFVVQD
jgi:hypothetical protein